MARSLPITRQDTNQSSSGIGAYVLYARNAWVPEKGVENTGWHFCDFRTHGSRKSTTLEAMVVYVHNPRQNLMTIEMPVEMKVKGAVQCDIKKYEHFPEIMKAGFVRTRTDS